MRHFIKTIFMISVILLAPTSHVKAQEETDQSSEYLDSPEVESELDFTDLDSSPSESPIISVQEGPFLKELVTLPTDANLKIERIENTVNRHLENIRNIGISFITKLQDGSIDETSKDLDQQILMQIDAINQQVKDSLFIPKFRISLVVEVLKVLSSISKDYSVVFVEKLLQAGSIPNCEGDIGCNIDLTIELMNLIDIKSQLFLDPKVQSLYYQNANLIMTKFLRRFVTERLDSLFNFADYRTSLKGVEIGKEPSLIPQDIERIRNNLKTRIDNSIFDWMLENKENLHLIILFDSSDLHKNKEVEKLDNLDIAAARSIFENEFDEKDRNYILGLKIELLNLADRIYRLDFALLEYLDRIEQETPVFMLDKIRRLAEIDFSILEARTVKAYVTILANLGKDELRLPHRKMWIDTMKAVADAYERTKHPEAEGAKAVYEELNNEFKKYDSDILETICNQHSPFFVGCGDLLYDDQVDDRLRVKEMELKRLYPSFHSFTYQFIKIANSANHSAQIISKMKMTKAPHKLQKLAEEHSFARMEPINSYFTIQCYLYQVSGKKNENATIATTSELSNKETYKIEDICPFENTPNVEKATFHFVTELRIKEADKSYWDYQTQTLASIPITLLAAEISGLVGARFVNPLIGNKIHLWSRNAVARSSFINGLKDSLFKKMLVHFGESLGGRVVHAVSGAIVFTAVQRLSYAGIGLQPLWQEADPESKTSAAQQLWNNYGTELVFGGVLFFVLPYVQSLYINPIRNLAKVPNVPMSTEHLASINALSFKQEAAIVGTRMIGDTLVFSAVPYVERTISKMVFKESDDIWLGWDTARNDFLHSAAVGTAFASFGNFKHRMMMTNFYRRGYLNTARTTAKFTPSKVHDWIFESGASSKKSLQYFYSKQFATKDMHKSGFAKELDQHQLFGVDLYKEVGLPRNTSEAEFKKAYRRMAATEHPDRGGDVEAFKKKNNAFDILLNKRAEYDRYLNEIESKTVDIEPLTEAVFHDRTIIEDAKKVPEIPGDLYREGMGMIRWLQLVAKNKLKTKKANESTQVPEHPSLEGSKNLSGYAYPQMKEVKRLMDLRDKSSDE